MKGVNIAINVKVLITLIKTIKSDKEVILIKRPIDDSIGLIFSYSHIRIFLQVLLPASRLWFLFLL
jgi:hypothetical protein